MDLTLHQLRLFLAVVDHGTAAAAADALGYTPSAVSQQLSGLERACGVAVFERVGRGLRLTDAGRVLVGHARAILDRTETALAALATIDDRIDGLVRLSSYESVASTLIPPFFALVRDRHPQLAIRFSQSDPDLSLPALLRGDLDLAFTVDYPHAPIEVPDGIHVWDITVDRFRLVVADDDPIDTDTISLRSLAPRPFISSPAGHTCGECVVMACRAAGFEPDVAHTLHDYPTSLQLVAAGEGVALIPDLGLVRLPPGVRVVDLREPITRRVQLAVRAASQERPVYLAVRDALRGVARGLSLDTTASAA